MHTVVYPIDALKIGGAEQQLLELVRGLDKSRFRPMVVALDPGGPLEPEFRAVPDVEVINLRKAGKFDARPLVAMARLLRTKQASIVQPFLTPATFFGLLPALIVRTPIKIVTERCGVRRVRGPGYTTYRIVEDQLTRFADAVVANSAAGRDLLVSRGVPSSRAQVVYNGVNSTRLVVDHARAAEHRERLHVPGGGHVVTILANLTVPKAHDILLRAMAMLEHSDQVRLAIVGDGTRRAELEDMTRALGLADRVVFFGFQRKVADFLAMSDMLVCASRDNEGCSNSILEAMALGVPVVATSVGGNPELIEHDVTGWLVPVDEPQRLARVLEHVLAEPGQRHQVAERARQQVRERFSLERMVADYQQLYERLLTRRYATHAPRTAPTVGDVRISG